jgi:ABC-type nitrate/sulfonate/bicarbonate transport system substrate-binding protein
MALKKKTAVSIALGVAVAAVVAFGAFKGRTKLEPPSALTSSGSAYAQSSSAAPDRPLRVIKTFTRRDCSLAPWLITDKLGYFAEEGVQLVFTGEVQPAQQVPSILNGTNDVTSLHPNAAAVVINGGAKIRGVLRAGREPAPDLAPEFRHMWWFVNPDKHPGVKSFRDLKDIPGQLKFSTITTTSCSDFLANEILLNYGVPLEKIEWVTMPDVQGVQALAQGLTDVGGVHPPFYKGMLDAGQRKIADTIEANLPPESAGLTYYFFNQSFIDENPEAVRAFNRAMVRGQKFINENPEQARLWTQEAIGVPVSANHYYAEDDQIHDEQIVPWLAALERSGTLPSGKLKPSDLIDRQFENTDLPSQSSLDPGNDPSITLTASRL